MNNILFQIGNNKFYQYVHDKTVEQEFLFDKKEVHLSLRIAARHVFASRPCDMFCFSWTLILHVGRRLTSEPIYLR